VYKGAGEGGCKKYRFGIGRIESDECICRHSIEVPHPSSSYSSSP
jgi:hypothetical protein